MDDQWLRETTRRHFFQDCGVGLGKIALASLFAGPPAFSALPERSNSLRSRQPHYLPQVDRVIFLFMAGAPSQLDLFDHKPVLRKYDGKPVPAEVVKDQRYAFIERDANLMASRFSFKRWGQSGTELSEIIPYLREVVDDIVIIKSMTTDVFNHAPAQIFMNSGSPRLGHPSMGSWVTYGLGSEPEDLPGFVVLSSGSGTSGGQANWGCGFLPTVYQGVPFRSQGEPVLNLNNPPGFDDRLQRDSLDLLRKLNQYNAYTVGDPEISTRITAYEMAYRMQSSAPDLLDLSGEDQKTLKFMPYGVSSP